MLPFPIDGRALIVIVLVVVSLLLMIFAPQVMANLLGEPLSLIGRLVGTIADWLQKGADKLFALVKSVFLIGHPGKEDPPDAHPAPAPASPAGFESNYQAKILEHPVADAGVDSSDGMSTAPHSSAMDHLAPYESEPAPSITPYPNRSGSSSYPQSDSSGPPQDSDRVYGDPVYNRSGSNDNGSSMRAMQRATPNGVYAGSLSGREASADSISSAPVEPGKPEEPEIHATWVGEVIISHVLYLVAGVIIVVSDFVFTVLRLQAVLFPDLPINPELANLSDLSGALFVSMVFLTGALTLDFLGVLPPPARLFPTMDDKKRRMFLALSLGAFLLNMAVVGILFFAGQTLISYASSWPLGSLIIATLIGVLQVLVMFLAAWGAIRGLSALLALSLGLLGIVFEFLALIFTWIHEALRTVGEHLVPDLIFGVAGIFRPNPEHAPRPAPVSSNVLSVVGYGNTSSDFMAQLCADVTQLYTRSSLIAAGAYADDYHTVDDVRRRLNRLAITNNITTSGHEGAPVRTLRDNIVRAYHKRGDVQTTLLWIVDGEKLNECLGVFEDLKRTLGRVNITVVCFLPQNVRDRQPYRELLRLSSPSPEHPADSPPITLTVLIDRSAPLYHTHGDLHHGKVLARGLAAMTLAPIHNAANQSFLTIVQNLNAAGYHFAALAVDSTGLVAARPQRGFLSWWRPEEQGEVVWQDALTKLERATDQIFNQKVGSSVKLPPDPSRVPVYVSYMAPLPAHSHDYSRFKSGMSSWLANQHNIESLSVVQGNGTDLSASKPQERGDRHGQVSVLYGIPDRDISQLFPEQTSRDSRGMDRSETSSASSAMRPASSELSQRALPDTKRPDGWD